MALEGRINATKEMISCSKELYVKLLWNASPEQKMVLEKGFDVLLDKSIKVMKGE